MITVRVQRDGPDALVIFTNNGEEQPPIWLSDEGLNALRDYFLAGEAAASNDDEVKALNRTITTLTADKEALHQNLLIAQSSTSMLRGILENTIARAIDNLSEPR